MENNGRVMPSGSHQVRFAQMVGKTAKSKGKGERLKGSSSYFGEGVGPVKSTVQVHQILKAAHTDTRSAH